MALKQVLADPLSDKDRAELERLLIARRNLIRRLAADLADATIGKDISGEAGNLSTMPIHLADVGSDVSAYDVNLGLAEKGHEELTEIEDALARIERGEYGRCESCRVFIGLARLQAIPQARFCVACQSRLEQAA